MSLESDIYARSVGGGGSAGAFNLSPETEELLQAALANGGATAQVASEIVHPNGSFISSAKEKMGGALMGVLNTLMIPSNGIAALMDTDLDFAEARRNHVSPSDVLWKDTETPETITGRIAEGAARLTMDVLLDPLTYVTFGTSSGLIGLSKLTKIPIGPKTAKALGLATYTRKVVKEALPGGEMVDTLIEEAVSHRNLSKLGVEKLQQIEQRIEDTIMNDTITSWYSSTNVNSRLEGVVKSLRGKSDEEIDTYLKKKLPDIGGKMLVDQTKGAEYILAENLKKIYKMSDKELAEIAPGAIRSDATRFAEQVAIMNAMEEQAERLVRHTLTARKTEIQDLAKQRLSGLIERNMDEGGLTLDKFGRPVKDQFGNHMVRELAKEWVDRGGIKVFGQTMIAGQAIRSVASLLPGLSYVDRITAPVRHYVAALVNNNYTVAGKTPETLRIMQDRARNTQDQRTGDILSHIPDLYKRLGVTKDEDNLISQALVLDKPPVGGEGSRLNTLWSLLRTAPGEGLAKRVAKGEFGAAGKELDVEGMERAWKAAEALRNQMQKNLILSHESGIAKFPSKNYLPHIALIPPRYKNPFIKMKTARDINAEKGNIAKFRSVSDPTKISIGTPESLKLQRHVKTEERNRIIKHLEKEVATSERKQLKLTTETEAVWAEVSEKMVDDILDPSKKVISDAAQKDKANLKALEMVIREAIPEVDRKRVLNEYVEKNYENGQRLRTIAENITEEDLLRLREQLAFGDMDLDRVASNLLSSLGKFELKRLKPMKTPTGTKKVETDYDKALKEMHKLIHDNAIEGKKQYLKEALNKMHMKADDLGMTDTGVKTEPGMLPPRTPALLPKQQFDVKNMGDVLSGLSEQWHKNPGGIGRLMETVLGKEFEMRQVLEDIHDIKGALSKELNDPGLKLVDSEWFYMDKNGEIFERVRATAKEINDAMFNGEEMFTESALKAALVGSLNAVRAATSKDLIDDIAMRFGVPQDSAPSHFVQLGITGLQKEVKDMGQFFRLQDDGTFAMLNHEGKKLFFEPTVAESVNRMLMVMSEDAASSILWRDFDRLTNIWKASVTSIWPAFHGRNAISNVFQHMMDLGYQSLNPSNHLMAGRIMKYNRDMENIYARMGDGDPKAFRELMDMEKQVLFTDSRGHDWSVGEMLSVTRSNVIAFNPEIIGQTDIMRSSRDRIEGITADLFAQTKGEYAGKIARKALPIGQEFVPFQVGRTVGNYVEQQARLVSFVANLKNTGDVELAAFQTKHFLFDYQNLTPFEKTFMRRVVPFYTYSRKNFELQVESLLSTPGRTAFLGHAFQTISDVLSDGPLSDEERAMLPEWMRHSLNIVKERNGENVSLITTLGTPLEQPFQQLNNLMGSINPLIKFPIEERTNFSFFHGRALSQVTDATAYANKYVPETIRNFIGLTKVSYQTKAGKDVTRWVSLKPENMHKLNNLPFISRVQTSLKLLESPDLDTQEKGFQLMFGFRSDEIDLMLEGKKRETEVRKEIEHVLDEAGLGYTFERFQLK